MANLTLDKLEAVRKHPAYRQMPTMVRDAAILATLQEVAPHMLAEDYELRSSVEAIANGSKPGSDWHWNSRVATLFLKFPSIERAIANVAAAEDELRTVAASIEAELTEPPAEEPAGESNEAN